jgi:hypothetical protein
MKPAARPTLAASVDLPDTDHMGESILQALISELLRPLIERYLRDRGVRAFVGADQFFYYNQDDISQRVAPDVYVLPGIEGPREERVWRCWDLREPPSFALEIVGRDVAKDYEDAPGEYKKIGARELVVFDPDWTPKSKTRVRWQVWRRVAKRGLVPVLRTNEDRVESKTLGCWLRLVGEGGARRVRLATGPFGDELIETDDERATRASEERARADEERARADQERARADEERARAELALDHERDARLGAERERDALRAMVETLQSAAAKPRPRRK